MGTVLFWIAKKVTAWEAIAYWSNLPGIDFCFDRRRQCFRRKELFPGPAGEELIVD
jgi:hypothetical protein